MRRNRLRELLRAGRPTLGTHIHSAWPTMVELVGHAGIFDYVEFSGEYAPYDLFSLENFGRAAELYDHMSSMMKLDQEPEPTSRMRAIGCRDSSTCSSPTCARLDDVRSACARVRVRVARGRAACTGPGCGATWARDGRGLARFVQALDDAVVAVMIEKASAVENVEAMLSVNGSTWCSSAPPTTR